MEKRVAMLGLALGVIISGALAVAIYAKLGSALLALAAHTALSAAAVALYARLTRGPRGALDQLRWSLEALARGDTSERVGSLGEGEIEEIRKAPSRRPHPSSRTSTPPSAASTARSRTSRTRTKRRPPRSSR
jgi:hypothetical protein